jgi:hypothetical protein
MDFVHRPEFYITRKLAFRKMYIFPSSDEGRETPTLLGKLERVNFPLPGDGNKFVTLCFLFHLHFHFFSPSFVRLVNVLKHFSVFSTLVTFKIFKTTTFFDINWPSSGVNTCF